MLKSTFHMLTSDKVLQPFVEEYLYVVLLSTSVYLLLPALGYLIGIGILMFRILSPKSSLAFTTNISSIDKKRALVLAVPLTIASLLMTTRMFGLNFIIEDSLGTTGVGQLAVVRNIMVLVTVFVAGLTQSIQPVTGFMLGQKDYKGFNFTIKRGLAILLVAVSSLVIIYEIFPHEVLQLMGYRDVELIDQSVRVVRISSTC